MRVAALYDIHGNLPALEAALSDVVRTGADLIIVGSDIVPGPMPCETLQRLRNIELPVHYISGNGELAVLAEANGKDSGVRAQYRECIRWNAAQLSDGERSYLASWPQTHCMPVDGLGDVLFCHATPNSSNDIFTRITPEESVIALIGSVTADVMICGHTHMQFDRRVGRLRVVNAGSVGMPFGKPGAYWLLLGPDIELRHTLYDLRSGFANPANAVSGSGSLRRPKYNGTAFRGNNAAHVLPDVTRRGR